MYTQIEGFDSAAGRHPRRKAYGVKVGQVRVGGGAPIVVQSMTNTDTADIESTFKQTVELAEAGSEIVRWTVNVPEAAAAVPEIKKRSEERRVGKECRYRWSRRHSKNAHALSVCRVE